MILKYFNSDINNKVLGMCKLETQKLELGRNDLSVRMRIHFRKDDQTFYLMNASVDSCRDSKELQVYYGDIVVHVEDGGADARTELNEIVVNFLANIKMYLVGYQITNDTTWVSYDSSSKAFADKLTYSPCGTSREISLDVFVQLEDGVNYEDLLHVRIKEPKASFPKDESIFADLKDDYDEELSIDTFVILDEEKYRELVLSTE